MKTKNLFLITALALSGKPLAAEVTTLTRSFQASGAVTVAANGDVFVADYGVTTLNPNGDKVYRVNSAGDIEVFASNLDAPSGNVIGPDGALYQSSYVGGRIYRINDEGSSEIYAQGSEILGPVGVEFNQQGELIIANCNNNTLAKKSAETLEVYLQSNLLSCPAGLAFDNDDNLYVTNFGNGNILKITPSGDVSILATTPGGRTKPNGSNAHITFGNNQLYLVSSATHQVFSLSLTGELEVIAGSGTKGNADGLGLDAEFSLPNGIDISTDGSTLYVNDSIIVGDDTQVSPNVLRKISLPSGDDFKINAGLSGAWYEPATNGSGMFFDVIADREQLNIAWFTWAAENNPVMPSSIGSSQQRWVTGLGGYNNNQANLTLYQSTGGVFDSPASVNTETAGTMNITFNDCFSATVDYVFDDGLNGSLDIQRISADQVCQILTD